MHASNKLFSLFAAASALAPGAWSAPSARLAIPQSANPARRDILDGPITGKGTFYGGAWAGGTCSFSTYTQPAGLFGTALAGPNWDTSGNCGGCVSVTGPNGKTITAMVSNIPLFLANPLYLVHLPPGCCNVATAIMLT